MRLRRTCWIALALAGCTSPHRAVAPLAYAPGAAAQASGSLGEPPPLEPTSPPVCVDWKRATLSNGIPVSIAERHAFPSTAVRLVIATGEAPGADLGDADFERRELVATAFLGPSHTKDSAQVRCSDATCSVVEAAASLRDLSVAELMDRLAGRVRAQASGPTDTSRFLVGAELRRKVRESPSEAIWRNAGRLALGWRTDRLHGRLPDPSLDEVLAARAQMFQPTQTRIFVAGDVAAADVVREAERAFGAWQPAMPPGPHDTPAVPAPRERAFVPRVAFVQSSPTYQPFVAVVARGPAAEGADAWAFRIALQILGGGQQSEIYVRVREEMAAAYVTGAEVRWMPGASVALLGGWVERGRAIAVTRSVLATVRGLRDTGPRDDDLTRARTVLKARILEAASINRGLVEGAELTGSGLRPTDPCEVAKAIDAVTADEVRAAMKTYFAEARLGVLVTARDDQLDAWPADLDLGPVARRDWYANDLP